MKIRVAFLIVIATFVAGCGDIDSSVTPDNQDVSVQVRAVGVDRGTADAAVAALAGRAGGSADQIIVFRYGDEIMVRVGAADSLDSEYYRYYEFRRTAEYYLGLEYSDSGVAVTEADGKRVVLPFGADKITIEEAHELMCEQLQMDVIITCVVGPGLACLAVQNAYDNLGC